MKNELLKLRPSENVPSPPLTSHDALFERKPDGDLVFREATQNDAAAYALLSHTWLANNNEEVSVQDIEAGTDKNKAR